MRQNAFQAIEFIQPLSCAGLFGCNGLQLLIVAPEKTCPELDINQVNQNREMLFHLPSTRR